MSTSVIENQNIKHHTILKHEIEVIKKVREEHTSGLLYRAIFSEIDRTTSIAFKKNGRKYVMLNGYAVEESEAPLASFMYLNPHPNVMKITKDMNVEALLSCGTVGFKEGKKDTYLDPSNGWMEVSLH